MQGDSGHSPNYQSDEDKVIHFYCIANKTEDNTFFKLKFKNVPSQTKLIKMDR